MKLSQLPPPSPSASKEDGAGCLSRCVSKLLKSTCANQRCLRTLGYEQVLVVRNLTHLALWLSAFISIVFAVIWFSDVFTLQCLNETPLKGSYLFRVPGGKCTVEAVGMLIFFASFRDSVRMIAHFDDERQQVLKEKRKALEFLQVESEQVLESAKHFVNQLREKVVELVRQHMADFAVEVFTIVLPWLHREAQVEGSKEMAELSEEISMRLRDILGDVRQLAAAMHQGIVAQHPEVFSSKSKLAARQSLEDVEQGKVMPSDPAKRGAAKSPAQERMQLWDESLAKIKKDAAWARVSVDSFLGSGDTQLYHMSANESREEVVEVARQLGQEAMKPMEDLLKMPEWLEGLKGEILQGRPGSSKLQRIGCGRLPPSDTVSKCCVPRAVAVCCNLPLFLCACYLPRRDLGCCKSAHQYPKRGGFFGIFWIQIHTKLQERLMGGVFFSCLYCVFYLLQIKALVTSLDSCQEEVHVGTFYTECVLEVGRKSFALLTLLCYIPALTVCLYHIERLDAVMETMETIRDLESVQRVVRTFNHQMDLVAEQRVQLRAIEERTLPQIELAKDFGRSVCTPDFAEQDVLVRQRVVSQFADCMREVGRALGPADEWVRLPRDEQKLCLQRAQQEIDKQRKFFTSPAVSREPSLTMGVSFRGAYST